MSTDIEVSNEINMQKLLTYDMYTISSYIINLYKNKTTFDYTHLIKLEYSNFYTLITSLMKNINFECGPKENHKNFKSEYFNDLIKNIVTTIDKYPKKKELFTTNEIPKALTIILNGYLYLNKFKSFLKDYTIDSINEILSLTSMKGSFRTFLFWVELYNIDVLKDDYNFVFQNSIKNADDRIYKWYINEIKKNNSLLLQKTYMIEKLLDTILTSNIPDKFKLKRIKILSENCNLVPFFNYMIEIKSSIDVTKQLIKYYYKNPLTFNIVVHLSDIFTNDIIFHDKINTLINMIKTEEEKGLIVMMSLFRFNNCFGINFNKINLNTITENFYDIFKEINLMITDTEFKEDETKIDSLDLLFNRKCNCGNKCLSKILKIFCDNGIFHKYVNNTNFIGEPISPILLRLCKFYSSIEIEIIHINRVLSFLRTIAKKKTKSKVINFQTKYFPVFQELLNFTPSKKPVLKNGSINWQYQNQKFTNVPPRHLLPYEINIYSNFLIREKADGILINNLTSNIYPSRDELLNNHVKAEYIEELDLYLVFDIDINKNIIDRYNYLRELHPYTAKTELQTITSTKELIDFVEKERIIFNKFLEETKENEIRWYPKISFLVNNPSYQFKSDIIDMIHNKDSKLSKIINFEGKYNCDGLILTPLTGTALRDIKIKPREMMTIDLLYDGKSWVDKDKNTYNNIIHTSPKKNKIYRCYPVDDTYEAREIRFDKKYPNSYDIINIIETIYKFDWTKSFSANKNYYQITNVNLHLDYKKELEHQTNLLEENIKKLCPEQNKHWLDLGCGKGKLINMIKKYKPTKYVGMDIDENILLKNIHLIDSNEWIKLSQCNLRENWYDNSKWYNIKNMKFDYILLNFSAMYLFDSDIFWTCLKQVSKPTTKIVFNVVSNKIKSEEFKLRDAYMKYKENKIIYYFPWAHKEEQIENFIEKSYIEDNMKKYGFLIESIPTSDKYLASYYDWYVIVHT